jgi:hypothetical protein
MIGRWLFVGLFNPPGADEGLIPCPLGANKMPVDTPLLAVGWLICQVVI